MRNFKSIVEEKEMLIKKWNLEDNENKKSKRNRSIEKEDRK